MSTCDSRIASRMAASLRQSCGGGSVRHFEGSGQAQAIRRGRRQRHGRLNVRPRDRWTLEGRPCDDLDAVWLRLLIVVAVALFWAQIAHAQAPPQSFFAGRSNDELRALASDPRNDVLLRRSAATTLVMTLADAGDLDAADAAGREFVKNIDPGAIKHAKAVRRRSHVHVVAVGALGIALGIAVLSTIAARRSLADGLRAARRMAPVFAFFMVYMGLVGGYLASSYENSSSVPFVLFALLLLPLLVLLRVWSAVGQPGSQPVSGAESRPQPQPLPSASSWWNRSTRATWRVSGCEGRSGRRPC